MSFAFKSVTGVDLYIYGHNDTDKDGNPAGGYVHMGLRDVSNKPHVADIFWQDGPVNREAGEKPNGAMVEDVLMACQERLEFYQKSDYACAENSDAIGYIAAALIVMEKRREGRRSRGVEGKNEK